jgi:hypothetical protein
MQLDHVARLPSYGPVDLATMGKTKTRHWVVAGGAICCGAWCASARAAWAAGDIAPALG